MSRVLIIRNRATQDIRQQANYILSSGNTGAAEQFLELTEATFDRILLTPGIGKQIDSHYFGVTVTTDDRQQCCNS
jgi:toxin ParE1/3/4